MATKLKNLKISKVDFVDEGANPDAHLLVYKNKGGKDVVEEKSPNFMQKIIAFIGKAAGMEQDEIDSAMNTISKSESESFGDKYAEFKNRKIADEIWDICYALQSSLVSILNDDELDSTSAGNAMRDSIAEFNTVITQCVSDWSNGSAASIVSKDVTEADIELMKANIERLESSIEKATDDGPKDEDSKTKEGEEEMKIDKSKLSAAERDFLEEIEKKASVEEDVADEPQVNESVADTPNEPVVAEPDVTEADDVTKGLNPVVAAELEELKKFKAEIEDKQLMEVAKKYEVIGKNADELMPKLKSLKAAGGTAYDDMIAILDEAVNTVEKSGAFTEIGKSGHGTNEDTAWAEAEAKATELMKSKAGLTRAQALDEVLQADAELAERCEKED